MIAAIILRSDRVLDKLVSKNDENQVKPSDDLTQQHNVDKDDTTTPTYKPIISFPQHLNHTNINASYDKILDVFKQV